VDKLGSRQKEIGNGTYKLGILNDVTTDTAIIGAVTGTLSLLWNIITRFNERGRLSVSAEVTSYHDLSKKPHTVEIFLNIKVTNSGKRPVSLTHVIPNYGFEKPSLRRRLGISTRTKGTFSWMENDMPKELLEGQVYFKRLPLNILNKDYYSDFLFIRVNTSTDKVYYSPEIDNVIIRNNIELLKKELFPETKKFNNVKT
jgi:hypothetical protein